MVTIKMNATEICQEIAAISKKVRIGYDELVRLDAIANSVKEIASDLEFAQKQLSRYSDFGSFSDRELATLAKFKRGHDIASPGRKSTVKACIRDIGYYWEYFLKIPSYWLEHMAEIEQKYPKSVVYKALKQLCF